MMEPVVLQENPDTRIVVKVNDQEVILAGNQIDAIKDVLANKEPDERTPLTSSIDARKLREFDHNHYATKKTIAMALMDIALIATNASHLKAIMQVKYDNQFYGFMATFVCISVIIQILLGAVLLFVGRGSINTRDYQKLRRLNWANDIATALILLLTMVNVMVASFGLINGPFGLGTAAQPASKSTTIILPANNGNNSATYKVTA